MFNLQKGRSKGQNIRTLNPALKAMVRFNRMYMVKQFGPNSSQAVSAQELLSDMTFGTVSNKNLIKFIDYFF